MKMRYQYILEEARSTIMDFFCIPLNLFVFVVLYKASLEDLSDGVSKVCIFLQENTCKLSVISNIAFDIRESSCSFLFFQSSS